MAVYTKFLAVKVNPTTKARLIKISGKKGYGQLIRKLIDKHFEKLDGVKGEGQNV